MHRTAPGEEVEIELLQQRGRWARGKLLRVIQPSAARRAAPCPHYAECGGCTLEHLEYEAQLEAKSRIVGDALTRIGKLDLPAPRVTPSPNEFRYRNRVSFALRRGSAGRVYAGFHALHAPGRIVPIDGACLLPEEPIARTWDALRAAWGPDANRLPSGEQLRLTLRTTLAGRVSLLIEGGYSPGKPHELIEAVDGLESIWHKPGPDAAVHIGGAPGLPEVWGEEHFEMGGTAFLQVNRAAAALLEEYVMELAGEVAGSEVVDAYCGIGMHAGRLARAGARVTGLELDPEAVRIAREIVDLPGVRFVEGRVEELLGEYLPVDLLIVNPPRAGLAPAATEAVLQAPPEQLIYISCDPATLARDLKALSNNFEIASLRSFDLFPQTAHVETVVEARRRTE